ncbi:MAG TPA: hypothetical protein VJP80_02570 [Candidatus Saccharimonadales bacterium]|nr:hypothetical protein [Candidatus Saccharimonadales bacterium]
MIENYRDHPTFNPDYVYKVQETGAEVPAPFPVAVFGIGAELPFLGIGSVIGSVETVFGDNPVDNPVIEVQDTADGTAHTLLGREIWWSYPIPPEFADHVADGSLPINSVRLYLEELRPDEI